MYEILQSSSHTQLSAESIVFSPLAETGQWKSVKR